MKKIFLIAALFLSSQSIAGYNDNFNGKVTEILTYTYSSQILVRFDKQPSSHPSCTKLDYLIIPPETPDNIKQLIMSRLLTAYALGEEITVGIDKEGSCYNGRIQIYRIG